MLYYFFTSVWQSNKEQPIVLNLFEPGSLNIEKEQVWQGPLISGSVRNIFTNSLHIPNEPNTYMKHVLNIVHPTGARSTRISDQETRDPLS